MNNKHTQGAQLFEPPAEFKLLKRLSIETHQLKETISTLQYKLNQLEQQIKANNKKKE